MPKWDNQKTQALLNAILVLNNLTEAKKFFRDLLTEQELIEFSNRWQAARLLKQKVPYTKIVKETGLSSTTVARIAKWLNKGMGGYKLILNRLNSHHHSRLFSGKD